MTKTPIFSLTRGLLGLRTKYTTEDNPVVNPVGPSVMENVAISFLVPFAAIIDIAKAPIVLVKNAISGAKEEENIKSR